MAESAIVRKLNLEFALPISSERQVVYILAELRKLLELTGQTNEFIALQLYSSWAVHPSLKKQIARDIVKIFDDGLKDDYARMNAPSGTIIAQPVMDRMQEFFKTTTLERFREELVRFCGAQNIDADRLNDAKEWAHFVDYYCRVIEDCPLVCRDDSTTYVKSVVVRRTDITDLSASDPHRDYLCAITWFWVDSNGRESIRTQNLVSIPKEATPAQEHVS
jgi:hypothetical protein